jgi:hypothetical protein
MEESLMHIPNVDDVQRALRDLADGLPGRNSPHPTGTGELDNAEVRELLASAASTVLLGSDPSKAFEELARYFDEEKMVGWFGTKRAEVILELLAYQSGWDLTSSWLGGSALDLQQLDCRPDRRWLGICSRLIRAFPPTKFGAKLLPQHLGYLATALAERIR